MRVIKLKLLDTTTVRIEWSEPKRLSNFQKHGVDFQDAALWLVSAPHLRYPTQRNNEDRYVGLVEIENRLFAIVYAEGTGKLRIISARRAQKREERDYRQFHAR